ncbi:MAG: hypothetical protein QMB63_04190 [Clostridiaceae bacterium]
MTEPDKKSVELVTPYGRLTVLARGAALISWKHVINGNPTELLCQSGSIKKEDNPDYVGAIVGPRAGRYDFGEGVVLHSGDSGTSNCNFTLKTINNSIVASLEHESGFYTVTYSLSEDGLNISIEVRPEGKLILNPTSHLYFSIDGKTADEHILKTGSRVMCKKTGELATGLTEVPEELDFYLHRFIMDSKIDDCFLFADPEFYIEASGIRLKLITDSTSAVIYTYDFPEDKSDLRSGIAIEPQAPPNAQAYDEDGYLWKLSDDVYSSNIKWKIELVN